MKIFRITWQPPPLAKKTVWLIPFIICFFAYMGISVVRTIDDPKQKSTPTIDKIVVAFYNSIFTVEYSEEPDFTTGTKLRYLSSKVFGTDFALDDLEFEEKSLTTDSRLSLIWQGVKEALVYNHMTREELAAFASDPNHSAEEVKALREKLDAQDQERLDLLSNLQYTYSIDWKKSWESRGALLLIKDTWASAQRWLLSLVLIWVLGVSFGLYMGSYPIIELIFGKFVDVFDKFTIIALLPIIFIAFDVGETAKIVLMVAGVTPTIVLDTAYRARSVHKEQIVKGFTLGASDSEIVHRVILPQIFPQVLETMKLNFKMISNLLLMAEFIEAKWGIGYRIYIQRKWMNMDLILAYVLFLALIVFVVYTAVTRWINWRYKWQEKR